MSFQVFAPDKSVARIPLPASKSISNRMLILNALSHSPYAVDNLSDCDDTRVMVAAMQSAGNCFDIHAAGTAMRFMTAFLSQQAGEWELTGSARMKQRPIRLLVDALRQLGARIEYLENEGFPPLKIFGQTLTGGQLTLKGDVSSQYISALLMTAPYMRAGLELTLTDRIISRPYIAMTLQLMRLFGADVRWDDKVIAVAPGTYTPVPFTVESDWSAASYWYEIAALLPGSEFELSGLQQESVQGDAAVAGYFSRLGVATHYIDGGVRLCRGGASVGEMVCDLTDQPDLAQTLVVTCALKGIPFRFTGLRSLKIKETDRMEALKTELKKLGYSVTSVDDAVLQWNGERCTPEAAPVIDTYDDHRMAMAFAPAAAAGQPVVIRHPEVVDKSYPSYWQDLTAAGFKIQEI